MNLGADGVRTCYLKSNLCQLLLEKCIISSSILGKKKRPNNERERRICDYSSSFYTFHQFRYILIIVQNLTFVRFFTGKEN